MDKINPRIKGELTQQVKRLLQAKQVKACINLQLIKHPIEGYYFVECIESYARKIPTEDVVLSLIGINLPHSYFWPQCPKDCEFFKKSKNFVLSLNKASDYAKTYPRLPILKKKIISFIFDCCRLINSPLFKFMSIAAAFTAGIIVGFLASKIPQLNSLMDALISLFKESKTTLPGI